MLARLTGTADPLDARLVEAYWLGRDLGVDREEFGRELLAVLGPRAGAYWTHLTADLLAEAAPDHGFHVFGVYPWSRLLAAGPQPLFVLDSCRIRWGTVVGLDPLTVSSPRLTWDGRRSGWASPPKARSTGDGVALGDVVAVHWDRLVDRAHRRPGCEVLAASRRRPDWRRRTRAWPSQPVPLLGASGTPGRR